VRPEASDNPAGQIRRKHSLPGKDSKNGLPLEVSPACNAFKSLRFIKGIYITGVIVFSEEKLPE
jgi:hypothetical protein